MDAKRSSGRRPRELRRRVVLPARVRTPAGWSDACILNVSSRGLLIHARVGADTGTRIELHHRHHAIVARVVWRSGARAGLRSEDRVPVEDFMILGQAHNVTLTATDQPGGERRLAPRHEASRARGRTIEFAGALAIAVVLVAGMLSMVEAALARPLASIGAALGR